MPSRLIKTKADHRKLRAIIDENKVVLSTLPATGALDAGVTGTPYTVTFSVSNAVGNAHFAIGTGAFPTGLTLDEETGELAGTPTEVDTFNFQIVTSDDYGNKATVAYSIDVTAP